MTNERFGPRLLILYASQTGYAQETAERICREAKQRHYSVELKSMHEYKAEQLANEKLVVFICSVTGQGEAPDTMKAFWRYLLRKALPTDLLKEMSYGVFGQGDSSYAKFNFPAKRLHNRLLQLGAAAIVARGDGDDQHNSGVDGALDPWLDAWWTNCMALFPMPAGLEIIPSTILPNASYRFETVDGDWSFKNRGSKLATVLKNNRITAPDHFQDVRHFEFEVDESIEYSSLI